MVSELWLICPYKCERHIYLASEHRQCPKCGVNLISTKYISRIRKRDEKDKLREEKDRVLKWAKAARKRLVASGIINKEIYPKLYWLDRWKQNNRLKLMPEYVKKKIVKHPLKPWQDPESLFCDTEFLKKYLDKAPAGGIECKDNRGIV